MRTDPPASPLAVGVVGASARAAVQSLRRIGLAAWAVDLFGDRDLRQLAPVQVCPPEEYPQAVPERAAVFPAGPFLFTGGLENYPEVVARLMERRPLWGNGPEVLRQVRNPWAVAAAVQEWAAPVAPPGEPCPTTGSWLCKRLRSSGGSGHRWGTPGQAAAAGYYFQQFVAGMPCSAVFLDDRYMGSTRQLVGAAWLHAAGFSWCGNLGPLPPDERVATIGRRLQETFGLQGIWGIDYIATPDGPRLVEVNPRYPASAEVLELALRRSCLTGEKFAATDPAPPIVGKAVYYAPADGVFPEQGPWDAAATPPPEPSELWRVPSWTDVTPPRSPLRRGQPLITLWAAGAHLAECEQRLHQQARLLDALLAESWTPRPEEAPPTPAAEP